MHKVLQIHTDVAAAVAAVEIHHSHFESNSADSGGAIAVYRGAVLQVLWCTFLCNTAYNPNTAETGDGGAVQVFGDNTTHKGGVGMVIIASNFTGNIARRGAIFIQNATALNISGVQLVGNAASSWGGGLAVADEALGGC